jgi:hypothetical protein
MTNALEIYKPPFRADSSYIYSSNGVMSLMATDNNHDPEKLMLRTVEILNGDSESIGNPNISYYNGEIYLNSNVIMVVRGFGHLTGEGALNLSLDEAMRVQDQFGEWVCRKLRNDKEQAV